MSKCRSSVELQQGPFATSCPQPAVPPSSQQPMAPSSPSISQPPLSGVFTSPRSPLAPPLTQSGFPPSFSGHLLSTPTSLPSLPTPIPMSEATFIWGELDPVSACSSLSTIYSEIVHWRKNYFMVPYGQSGKAFVSELSRLFRAFADGSALESIALKAISVACVLLCLLYTSPSPRDRQKSRMPSSA